jgi:hypothetical protein
MMVKQLFIFLLFATVCISASAQSILRGTVTDSVQKERLPMVNVALYKKGVLKAAGQTDFDGLYRITEIDAGTYDVEFSMVGYAKFRHAQLQILGGQSLSLNVEMKEDTIMSIYVLETKKIPIVNIDQTSCGHEFVSKATVADSIWLSRRCRMGLGCMLSAGVTVDKDGNTLMRGSRSEGIIFFGYDSIRISNVIPTSEIEKEVHLERKNSVIMAEMRLNVRLSPNPATTTLHLELKKEIESLQITNVQGQLMGNWTNLKMGTLQVDVSTWTNGVYFATFKQGNTVLTEKFSVIH